jgi:hypothetical protein
VFEHRSEPLLPLPAFRRRIIRHAAYAVCLLLGSLALGTFGYWYFGGLAPIDALLNAAMLLGGMGPVGEIPYTSGKLFATFFALYAGLAFLGIATLLVTPIFHRVVHKFHLEEQHRREGRPRAGRRQSHKPPTPPEPL